MAQEETETVTGGCEGMEAKAEAQTSASLEPERPQL